MAVRAIKRSIDGALGPHGAWLLAPYDDLPASTGLNTSSVESIRETARLALAHDYQLCVHAIGDRANREPLNLFEEAFKSAPQKESRRWRVEHAQHLHPDDIPRFAKLGVIASMQGVHCTSDAVYVLQRLGLRRAMENGRLVCDLLLDPRQRGRAEDLVWSVMSREATAAGLTRRQFLDTIGEAGLVAALKSIFEAAAQLYPTRAIARAIRRDPAAFWQWCAEEFAVGYARGLLTK